MKTTLLPVLTAVLMPLAAFASQAPRDADSPELRRFENCTELEKYLEDLAIDNLRRQAEQWRSWRMYQRRAYGLPVGEKNARSADVAASAAPMAEAKRDEDSSSGPSAYTETNVQVGGVDEADIVKTDGKRLYVLAQGRMHIVKSWPAEDLARLGSVQIEGAPLEMFLGEDGQVIVFSNVPFTAVRDVESKRQGAAIHGGWNRSGTKVTVVDASNPERPRVVSTATLSGHYQSARRIGSSVRVVLADHLGWIHPRVAYGWRGSDEEGPDTWLSEGIRDVRGMSLEELLPSGIRERRGGVDALPLACDEVYRPKGAVRPGAVSVVTLDLDDAAKFHRTVLLTQPGHVYASHESLFVASVQWWHAWNAANAQRTFIHKLDISDPERSDYIASGAIDGHLLNQFALDEHRGHLRVATTENRAGQGTVNKVRVLATRGDRLAVIGQTPDLAPGERIFSARFMGDMGYVVTFRQIDPLFTLDLSNPRSPRVVGELKVPGFSTYIHPMGDGYLLTVGVNVPEGQNRAQGMKISVFDVRDPAQPKEAFTRVIENNAWSESLHQHKAFNYFAQKRLLAIPVYHHGPNGFQSELVVFRVHPRSGVRLKGTLAVSDLKLGSSSAASPIRRSVMADEYVYAISDAGIRVAEIDALDEPVATALFTPVPAVSKR